MLTGIRKIDEKLYEKFRDTDFGVEEATTIQLCAMRTTSSGYYHIEHEVQLMSGLLNLFLEGLTLTLI